MSYYDLVEFSLYDCADRKIKALSEELKLSIDSIYSKLTSLIDKVTKEYQQTEEYKIHEKHEKIIKKYWENKKAFENKYSNDTYDNYYYVFGVLREEEKLKEFKEQYKKKQEYQSSYYENYQSNYSYSNK